MPLCGFQWRFLGDLEFNVIQTAVSYRLFIQLLVLLHQNFWLVSDLAHVCLMFFQIDCKSSTWNPILLSGWKSISWKRLLERLCKLRISLYTSAQTFITFTLIAFNRKIVVIGQFLWRGEVRLNFSLSLELELNMTQMIGVIKKINKFFHRADSNLMNPVEVL